MNTITNPYEKWQQDRIFFLFKIVFSLIIQIILKIHKKSLIYFNFCIYFPYEKLLNRLKIFPKYCMYIRF